MACFSMVSLVLAALMLLTTANVSAGFDITRILKPSPSVQAFNGFLTTTKLADEINLQQTVTVLAVDDATMQQVGKLGLPLDVVKNIVRGHVLLDFWNPTKITALGVANNATTTTLFQTTGKAQSLQGFLNISASQPSSNSIVFSSDAGTGPNSSAVFVKTINQRPFRASVLQVSGVIVPPGLVQQQQQQEPLNVGNVLAQSGHGMVAQLLLSTGVAQALVPLLRTGVTIFAPLDSAFTPTIVNAFTSLDKPTQANLLKFHALPSYNPLATLRLNALKSFSGMATVMTIASPSFAALKVTADNGASVVINTGTNVSTPVTYTLLDYPPISILSIPNVLIPAGFPAN